MIALGMKGPEFDGIHAVASGAGVASSPCKKAWAGSIHVMNTSLLADVCPHGELQKHWAAFEKQSDFLNTPMSSWMHTVSFNGSRSTRSENRLIFRKSFKF